jgi:hypothetical protein
MSNLDVEKNEKKIQNHFNDNLNDNRSPKIIDIGNAIPGTIQFEFKEFLETEMKSMMQLISMECVKDYITEQVKLGNNNIIFLLHGGLCYLQRIDRTFLHSDDRLEYFRNKMYQIKENPAILRDILDKYSLDRDFINISMDAFIDSVTFNLADDYMYMNKKQRYESIDDLIKREAKNIKHFVSFDLDYLYFHINYNHMFNVLPEKMLSYLYSSSTYTYILGYFNNLIQIIGNKIKKNDLLIVPIKESREYHNVNITNYRRIDKKTNRKVQFVGFKIMDYYVLS